MGKKKIKENKSALFKFPIFSRGCHSCGAVEMKLEWKRGETGIQMGRIDPCLS